jgi:hypothetical protein
MAGWESAFGMRSLSLILITATSSCAPVISERTDEQEWIRYRSELQTQSRVPAAEKQKVPSSEPLLLALESVPARSIFLECSAERIPETCFAPRIREAVDSALTGEMKAFRALVLEENTYSKVMDQVLAFHQGLLSGIEISARERVRRLLESCGFPGTRGFSKEVENCVAEARESDTDLLLTQTSDRLGLRITTAAARVWILENQIKPLYESELARERKSSVVATAPSP